MRPLGVSLKQKGVREKSPKGYVLRPTTSVHARFPPTRADKHMYVHGAALLGSE
jgi:hypothetical protein